MTEDRDLEGRVRAALADVPQVEERRMFGSLGFLVSGTLRIALGAHGSRVAMVRTGAAQQDALRRPGVESMVMRGRELSGWAALAQQAIATDEDVAHWIEVALAAAPEEKVSTNGAATTAPAVDDPPGGRPPDR